MDILPSGGAVDSAQCPHAQSPCTATRAVGVGTLYQDTIYAAAARQMGVTAFLHRAGGVITPRRVGSASWVRGTSTLPSRAWGTIR